MNVSLLYVLQLKSSLTKNNSPQFSFCIPGHTNENFIASVFVRLFRIFWGV